MKKKFKTLEREQLLKKVASLSSQTLFVPSEGWVRTMRKALGMTTVQLARKLDVAQSRVCEIEKGEVSDQVTLKTLRAAAEAMGCRLGYAFIPEKPLEDFLREKAHQVAQEHITYVSHHMLLEDQALALQEQEKQITELAEELLKKPKKLWEE